MGRRQVSWFRKNKRKTTVQFLHPQGLIRNIIYDGMVKEPELVAQMLGLSPLSTEVSEMEDRASEQRLMKLSALLPIIDNHAEIAGKVSAASYAISSESDEDPIPEEVLIAMATMFKYVAFTSAVSCVSALIDLSLIEVTDGN